MKVNEKIDIFFLKKNTLLPYSVPPYACGYYGGGWSVVAGEMEIFPYTYNKRCKSLCWNNFSNEFFL